MKLEIIVHEPQGNPHPTPLLFVHGAWHGAWCWENFLPYFAAHGYPSYAVSLRGHGASEGRERLRWTRVHEYVDDVAEVVSNLPQPPILIGHSLGGLVVQKYLEKKSATTAVLLAPVPIHGVLPITLRVVRRHPLAFIRTNLTLSLYPLIGTPEMARELFFSSGTDSETLGKNYARMQDESYLTFLDMLAFALPRPQRVTTPVLILGAANDAIFSPAELQATARAHGTEAKILPDRAHDMMLERDWEVVANYIIQWLGMRGS